MRRLFLILLVAAVAIAFVMAVLPHPPRLPGNPPDKLQHVAAFAVLTWLSALSFPGTSAIRILIYLSGFGALIEAAQAIPMLNRDSDLGDWIVDTLAIAAVLAFMRVWPLRARPREAG